MAGTHEVSVATSTGDVAAIDFGGSGPDVLLVHDLTENAAVWAPVARLLVPDCHVVAIDLPEHGQTTSRADSLAQLHAVLAEALPQLELTDPVLVGQGAGGAYIAIEHRLGLPARGLVLLEGAFPIEIDLARRYLEGLFTPEITELLEERYGFGRRAADEAERYATTDALVAEAVSDWNYQGIEGDDMRAMIARSWARDADGWLRRPTTVGYLNLTNPDIAFAEGVGHPFEGLELPMVMLQATGGLYSEFSQAFEDYAAARPERRLDVLESTWTIAFSHPQRVADEIRALA